MTERHYLRLPSVNNFLGHSARCVVAGGNKGPFECAGVRQRNRSNTGGEVAMPNLFSLPFTN